MPTGRRDVGNQWGQLSRQRRRGRSGPNWHAIFRHPFSKHERPNRDLGDEWGGHRKRRGHYNFSKPTTSVAIILNTAKLSLTPNSLGSGTR
jgi:hypothetical protein